MEEPVALAEKSAHPVEGIAQDVLPNAVALALAAAWAGSDSQWSLAATAFRHTVRRVRPTSHRAVSVCV